MKLALASSAVLALVMLAAVANVSQDTPAPAQLSPPLPVYPPAEWDTDIYYHTEGNYDPPITAPNAVPISDPDLLPFFHPSLR